MPKQSHTFCHCEGAPRPWQSVISHISRPLFPVPRAASSTARPGRVMFEIAGVSEDVAREALRLASHKLPIKTKILKREDIAAQEVGE